jgi:hypothetical protein
MATREALSRFQHRPEPDRVSFDFPEKVESTHKAATAARRIGRANRAETLAG